MIMTRIRIVRALAPLASLIAALAFGVVAAQEAQEEAPAPNLPDAYELPGEAVFPEGIALDAEAGVFYVGATNGGTIFRADIESGDVELFAEGTQPTAIGMEVDAYGRLWVAGGPTGQVFVYDTRGGDLLRTYDTPAVEATFLNDLTFVRDTVYVTDSQRPALFRIEAGPDLGDLDTFVSFEGTPFEYVDGFNANGIVVAPGGWALVIVNSATGELYRVGLGDGAVSRVATIGEPLTAGDGMVVEDRTLYVVRNRFEEVARLSISPAGRAVAPSAGPIASEAFRFPTTAAVHDGSIFVVNSQFDRQGGEPDLPFDVVRVPIP
jgi:Cu-Zn family superoxide dismutase